MTYEYIETVSFQQPPYGKPGQLRRTKDIRQTPSALSPAPFERSVDGPFILPRIPSSGSLQHNQVCTKSRITAPQWKVWWYLIQMFWYFVNERYYEELLLIHIMLVSWQMLWQMGHVTGIVTDVGPRVVTVWLNHTLSQSDWITIMFWVYLSFSKF